MLLGHRARGSPVKLLSARRILATAVHPAAALHGRSSSSSSSASVGSAKAEDGPSQPQTRLPKFLLKEAIVAPEGYNRYRSVLPALATNICGGSVYAWSIFNGPLTRELGVVASCSADWALTDVVPVFSVNAACLGACTFATGKWLEAVGPRAAGAVAASCFSSGLVIGGIGVMYHQLPLVYLGYGFLGGCGAGLSYVSPVSNMSRWFPDKRGLATGSAVMGFGGGAMVAAPLDSYLLSVYSEPPTRLGDIDAVQVVNEGGARMADIGGGQLGEVVVATGKTLPLSVLLLMKVDAAAMIDHDSLGPTQKRKEDFKNAGV
jgi:MFS family permease